MQRRRVMAHSLRAAKQSRMTRAGIVSSYRCCSQRIWPRVHSSLAKRHRCSCRGRLRREKGKWAILRLIRDYWMWEWKHKRICFRRMRRWGSQSLRVILIKNHKEGKVKRKAFPAVALERGTKVIWFSTFLSQNSQERQKNCRFRKKRPWNRWTWRLGRPSFSGGGHSRKNRFWSSGWMTTGWSILSSSTWTWA